MDLADEVIKRARRRIEAGWAQYQASDKTRNNVCLTYALNEAADEIAAELPEMPAYEIQRGSSIRAALAPTDQAVAEVSTRVNQAIGEHYPGNGVKDSMIAFNDSTKTSQADVLAVLDRALALNSTN